SRSPEDIGMRRKGFLVAAVLALLVFASGAVFAWGWWGPADVEEDTPFVVPSGASLTSVATKLEDEGLIGSAESFLLRAKIFGSGDRLKAGEFMLPTSGSTAMILSVCQRGEVLRRFITSPEGMPSLMVWERLRAEPLLTGEVAVPEEGSLLPESYDFQRGETRGA